jgi:hypothetical protein
MLLKMKVHGLVKDWLLDVVFSNNDNLNEVVFQAAIATFDVKGNGYGVKDMKNHKNKG